MYAFRKPFTAGTFETSDYFGWNLKSTLVVSQIVGYMISKFIGIKIISEMPTHRRAAVIIGLIMMSEVALIGFSISPMAIKPLMMFFNGLPLGMVFGLVLAFLEGRKQTEALSAGLCASFILSSGIVKSIGRTLVEDYGVSEFHMPMIVGALFSIPLVISVWLLNKTPPPSQQDIQLRSDRPPMTAEDRRKFLWEYWPGLALLVFCYVAITIARTIRDDYAVEIWRNMGIEKTPSVFTYSELVVAFLVTFVNAGAIWITGNISAIRVTVSLMCVSFGLVAGSAALQGWERIGPFTFMVSCGIGLYLPYVAFHTTIFERLVAASPLKGNLGFLMYIADALGYLGYAIFAFIASDILGSGTIVAWFRFTLFATAIGSIAALLVAIKYFGKKLSESR